MEAVGAVMQGNAQAQQYTNQAALATRQAKDVDLQALQVSGQRRDMLRSTLANIAADQVQKNVDPDSPSSIAIQNSVKNDAGRAELNQRIGFLNEKQSLLWGAQSAKQGVGNAITSGWINAFTAVQNTGMKVAEAFA